jgi:hypothetical protein
MSSPTYPARNVKRLFPPPISRALGRLDRHARFASLLRGLGTTAMVVSVVMAIGMIADFVWMLPQTVRWVIWGVATGVMAVTFAMSVLGAMIRRRSAFDLAAAAERGHPSIEEQLTGAVDLLGSGALPHGSPRLIAAVADRAAEQAGSVEPSRVIPWRRALNRLAIGLIVFGAVAAPAGWWPDSYGRLARRFFMPWTDALRLGRHSLDVSPGDKAVPVGADLSVRAAVRARLPIDRVPEEAWLEWSSEGDAAKHRVAMAVVPAKDSAQISTTASGERVFGLTLPRLARTIRYRVDCGSARSPRYEVTVVEPPSVTTVAARVEPPAYAKLPATVIPEASRIEAFEGSKVTLEIRASRPVRSIEVEWPGGAVEPSGGQKLAASLGGDGGHGSVAVLADRSGPFAISLSDSLGIASRPDQPRRVVVRADAPPVVQVRGPDDVSDASPGDTLDVGIAARDDVAVASVELHYDIGRRGSSAEGGESGRVAVSLNGLGSASARGVASLALAPLGLLPGDSLTYRVRVADNRPAPRGPNVVWSNSHTLSIVAAAESLRVRASKARSSGLRGKLAAIGKDVVTERGMTDQLRQAAEAAVRQDGDWDETRTQTLNEREAAARKIEDRFKLLARELAASPGLRELGRAAGQVADLEAEAARVAFEKARRETDARARQAALERSAARLAAVNERVDDLARKLDAINQEGDKIGRLSELAKRQEELAAIAPTFAGDRAQSDRVQAEQHAIRNELDELLKKTPALLGLALDGKVLEAERLAERANALAERQREESRHTGDLSKRARELSELAKQQRELEDDARKLAVGVDQLLGENGRSRLNTESIAQAAPPIERGEVDAARERLNSAEHELRRLAVDLEDVPSDPKAKAGWLFRQQYALDREIDAALRSVAGKQLTPEEKSAFALRLKQLGQREQAIADSAATIGPPAGKEGNKRFPHDAARDAIAATKRAAGALASLDSKEIESGKDKARNALQRLSDSLPNFWQRQEPMGQKYEEARGPANEVAEEINRHIRETNPRPDRPATTAGAAAELAERLNSTADKQARAEAALLATEPEPRFLPQRDRALDRAKALASVLRDLRDPAKREGARNSLPRALVEAQTAMERLGQKLAGGVPADDLAQELADEQRAILDAAGTKRAEPDGATRAETVALERGIAGAIRNLAAPDAQLAQNEAIERADRAARALADKSSKPDAITALREAANAAQALADELAGRKSPGVQAKTPRPASQTRETELEPALNPEHAATARDLVRRERRIRERLQAMVRESALPQKAVRSESLALGRDIAEFQDRLRPLADRAQYPAQAAADHFSVHAPQALEQGIAHLGQGETRPAREDQRRAGALLEQGAQLAADLAATLRSERLETGPGGTANPADLGSRKNAGQAIGGARDQMRRAAQELEQARDAARASQSIPAARGAMHQAARDLQAAASLADAAAGASTLGFEDAGDPTSAPADGEALTNAASAAEGTTSDPESGPGAKAEPDLAKLKALVRQRAGRKWGELPGHLRNEILQMQGGRYRDDYARVIQLYFREIAGAGTTESGEKSK